MLGLPHPVPVIQKVWVRSSSLQQRAVEGMAAPASHTQPPVPTIPTVAAGQGRKQKFRAQRDSAKS
jgi:hypothetical protein